MAKIIKFSFPQIYFESHEVEVPDDFEIDQLANEQQIDFIYQHLTELDKQWIGAPVRENEHKKTIEQALDAGCAYIKQVEP